MTYYKHSVFPVQNYIDLGLYQFGYEKCMPSHAYGPASRNHYLFHYVLSGTGILYAQNSKDETVAYHIGSNQGFMIFPNQETTYIADSAHPWEYVWLEFDGLRVFEGLKMIGFSLNSPVYKTNSVDYRNIVRDEMLYIVENKDMPSLHLIGHLYLFLDALVNSLTSYASLRGKHLRSFYTQEAIAFIENHFHENITVESIAQACGLNRTYFGKVFKAEIGQPPQVFLNTYRMIIATNLLLTTKSSVTEISKNVGYDNPLHFSRAFKKYYGISPMKWKKEHKNRYN